MTFSVSPGIYSRTRDESFVVSNGGIVASGIVITSDRGPTELRTITSGKQFIELYGEPDTNHPSKLSAFRYIRKAGILHVKRVTGDGVKKSVGQLTVDSEVMLEFSSQNPGEWANDIQVKFGSASKNAGDGRFLLQVLFDGENVESFVVSRDPSAKNGFNETQYIEDVVNGRSDYITVSDKVSVTGDIPLGSTVEFTGGKNSTSISDGEISTGWEAFRNSEEVDVLVLINAGFASPVVQQKMREISEYRGDCLSVFDVQGSTNDDPSAMIDYLEEELLIDSYLCGMWGGWERIYDEFSDRNVETPSSGDVAAAIVRTVQDFEYWDAPAGEPRGVLDALGVTKVFSENERDLLYEARINPITSYAGHAAIIWGQKTLQQAQSSLNRVNAVINLIHITKQLKQALTPFIFEPNTATVRENIHTICQNYLDGIRQRGGLYGFSVDVSTDINTPQVIDNNELLVNVAVQLTKTAEFLLLTTSVKPTGVTIN